MQSVVPLPTDRNILSGAIINGVINAVINGAIQFLLLRNHAPLPLSVDGITNETQTVLGGAVPLAVSLAMILTAVAYLTVKAPKHPFWPTVCWLIVKHGLFAFGAVVSGAIIWQRVVGSVDVSLITATIVLSVIAGAVAGIINYMTIQASLLKRNGGL